MNQIEKGLASRVARFSTGLKLLLILSLFLLPLGLIAILASFESAADNRARRAEQTLAQLEVQAQRVSALLARTAVTIRAASAAVSLSAPESQICRTTLDRLSRSQRTSGDFSLHGRDNELRCATPGYRPPRVPAADGRRSIVEISRDGRYLRFALFDSLGRLEGTGEFARDSLAELSRETPSGGAFNLELVGGGRRMMLRDDYEPAPFVQTVTGTAPIVDDRLQMRIELGAPPLSIAQALTILMPVMMWMGAALIGWLILDWLLIRPLVRMQRAVAAYKPGDPHLDLPTLSTPAREIGELGVAFDRVAQTVARHEAELEAGIERQKRLVREVHHRVKNNLQVVASLLNLHARGVANDEVAAAYASIQRRVDALAVVHRNHYAELEENRGVALKPLISELGANLRATAPRTASGMQIRIDIDPLQVTQDVAVSVAFLITEIVEFAMFCGARAVSISIERNGDSSAVLAVESDSLRGGAECDPNLSERFERIVTGLSRQLRSTIERDLGKGRYSLSIAVIDRKDE